ncbi:MAG: PRC and DUF2382 domain-containing protein [Actinomycetota bacterium]|nr:PRC and DUF2382 domain-containing protein [Actinomycetota bacterium]
MQNEMTMDRVLEMRGAPVYSSDGEQIGKVEEIFLDDETRQPEWIGIGTGFFGTKRVLVPVQGAQVEDDAFRVPYSKDQVQDSPDVDSDEISQSLESELYSYYGLGYSESRSETGLPEGAPSGGADVQDDLSVTRSEEELKVGTRDVETGRVRLRKYVETEPVEMDVALQRETAQVRTEQIDQPVSGVELGEQEIEVPLRGEEAVVEKQTVARERITVDKDVETEQATVSDEVRRERVEVDEDR